MIRKFFINTVLLCGLIVSINANSALDSNVSTPLAPGYGELGYTLADIGSYELPILKAAGNGIVLNENGDQQSLHDVYKGKYTLLSFVYSNCSDINGCPLSSFVSYQLKTAMKKDKQLANNLRLVSLSFDPDRDTPEVMKLYGKNFRFAGDKGEWRFLTTKSTETLEPILAEYNQDIQREMSVNGDQSQDISHILRVFLIDPAMNIRNIYSVGFLHADVILNDFKTLMLEDDSNSKKEVKIVNTKAPVLSVPGDNKQGYETESYTTNSKSLVTRKGISADLFSIAMNPPLGLPKVPQPKNNTLSKEKINLGRKLFFDRRLSLNDTFSCAMCHVPEQGFASNELSMAVGIEGRSVRRNTPTIYNVAYASRLFHDGRDTNLENQVWGPLLARNEMANPSVGYVINKVKQIPDYKGLFEKAFDGEGVNMRTLSQAYASYQRTLLSADSAFDKWYFDKQDSALSDAGKRGFKIFSGKGKCTSCHLIESNHAIFTDNKMHNTGIGYNESMGIRPKTELVTLAPGVTVEVDTALIDSVGEKPPADTGLYEITQNPSDRWKYKTPGLRNVSLTAPYMHNGSLQSLGDVINFYKLGGVTNPLKDPLITPLDLTEQDQSDLVAFLKSLTGSNVDTLVSDAFAAPIGDLTHKDPNWAHGVEASND